ncbi:50S ribosomal protein L29 [Patescibacteria group bacterium]|nr:MAG: 50S ribosomal protein L29 [Patescibacteria group bacterium]
MKAQDVRKKSTGELQKLLGEIESELRSFRFGMAGAHTKNVRKSRELKADVARINLVINERVS